MLLGRRMPREKMNSTKAPNLEDLRKALDTSTGVNRTLGYTFVALLFYILLIVASTTDLQLFLPESTVRLPILDVELPLIGFYVVVPFIIVIFHFHLLINLRQHQEKYQRWKTAAGPKADPAILDPILLHFVDSFAKGSFMRMLVGAFNAFSIFTFPLINLIAMLWRFGDYHDFIYSSIQFSAILLDGFMIYGFFYTIFPIEKRNRLTWWKKPFLINHLVTTVSLVAATYVFNYALFLHLSKKDITLEWPFINRELIPRIDLTNQEHYVGQVPDGYVLYYLNMGDDSETAKQNALTNFAKPLDLQGRDIRFAVLNRLNLTGALMHGCSLDSASLNFANLDYANLNFAICRGTKFNGISANQTSFEKSNLQGTWFQETQLNNAKWGNTQQLQGAHFEGANLKGLELLEPQLKGASLNFAQLQGAELLKAQLQGANFDGAKLQGTYLGDAQLQGASFKYAELQGAYLIGANLLGVSLVNAKLRGIWCDSASLDSTFIFESDWTSEPNWDAILYDSFSIKNPNKKAEFIRRIKFGKEEVAISKNMENCNGIKGNRIWELWLKIACLNKFVAFGLIDRLDFYRVYPFISKEDESRRMNFITSMCEICPKTLDSVNKLWPNLYIPSVDCLAKKK